MDHASCVEDINIRNDALNFAWKSTTGSSTLADLDSASSVQRETFDIEDVAWSNGQHGQYVATAASNGKIMLYDLNRPGVEVGRLHEHHRQVHKVDFNPLEGQYLLSASQDGTVRLWDLRTFQHVMKCESKDMFPGRSDGVRHTKWSPIASGSFALGTDNGTVQRWDIRQNKTPVLKISAHSDTCNSIDWHPDGRHLISAGQDQNVKVWDLLGDRKQLPAFQLRTPKPVQNVRWRPPCYVSEEANHHVKQCTHFATSYRHYPVVHVWNLHRPAMPYRELHHEINSGTTDMMWHSQDLLWTVGPNGEFSQNDIRYIPRTLDRRPLQAFASAPLGELSFVSQARSKRSVPRDDDDAEQDDSIADRSEPLKSPNHSGSDHSFGRNSFEDKHLSSSFSKRHSRAPSFHAPQSLGSTPPSFEDFAKQVTSLDQTMRHRDPSSSEQVSMCGSLAPGPLNSTYVILARRYRPFLPSVQLGSPGIVAQNLEKHLGNLGRQSRLAGFHADAQTFRYLQSMLGTLQEIIPAYPGIFQLHRRSHALQATDASDEAGSTQSPQPSSHTSQAVTVIGLPSNGRIPLDLDGNLAVEGTVPPSTPPLDLAGGMLPESPEMVRKLQTDNPPNDQSGTVDSTSSINNDNHYDEDRRLLISDFKLTPKVLLSFDDEASRAHAVPGFHRHDSSESFQMFSSSSESHPRLSVPESPVGNWSLRHYSKHTSSAMPLSPHTQPMNGLDAENQQEKADLTSSLDPSREPKTPAEVEARKAAPDLRKSADEQLIFAMATDDGSQDMRPKARHEHGTSDDGGFSIATDTLRSRPSVLAKHGPLNADQAARIEQQRMPDVVDPGVRSAQHNSEPKVHDFAVLAYAAETLPQSVLDILELLKELLSYYAEQGNVQTASSLFLSFAPLLPFLPSSKTRSVSPSCSQKSFYDTLMSALSLTPKEATEIQAACHQPLLAASISPYLIESILATYHSQLFALQLNIEATLIRRLSYPAFPGVYEEALQDVDVGTLCTACRSSINSLINPTWCENCKTKLEDCSICWAQESPFTLPSSGVKGKKTNKNSHQFTKDSGADNETPATDRDPKWKNRAATAATMYPLLAVHPPGSPTELGSNPEPESMHPSNNLYTACTLCAHTTHLACALAWFMPYKMSTAHVRADGDPSIGTCPVPECDCDCAPGFLRTERIELFSSIATPNATHPRHGKMSTSTSTSMSLRLGSSMSPRLGSSTSPRLGTSVSTSTSTNISRGGSHDRVQRDDWAVGESRAVRRVVGALRGKQDAGGTLSDGGGGSNGGNTGKGKGKWR